MHGSPVAASTRCAMLPLGDFWNGDCHAASPVPIENPSLLQTCNLGYARAACPHFPGSTAVDGVRFTISRDDGDTLGVCYVLEGNHHPVSHGTLEYSHSRAALLDSPASPMLRRQAAAYIEIYLRRTKESHAGR